MGTNLLNAFIMALIPYAAIAVSGAVLWVSKAAVSFLKVKFGNEKYNSIKNKAVDTWNEIEEMFRLNPVLKTGVDAKFNAFAASLRTKVPGITDETILAFNKALAGEFNKNKAIIADTVFGSPIQETTPIAKTTETIVKTTIAAEPATVTVQPIVETVTKYVTPDGVELRPVSTTVIQ